MKTILIKPHHFMDIIKLYGTGIHNFVPDEKWDMILTKSQIMIIHNPDVPLRLTIMEMIYVNLVRNTIIYVQMLYIIFLVLQVKIFTIKRWTQE